MRQPTIGTRWPNLNLWNPIIKVSRPNDLTTLMALIARQKMLGSSWSQAFLLCVFYGEEIRLSYHLEGAHLLAIAAAQHIDATVELVKIQRVDTMSHALAIYVIHLNHSWKQGNITIDFD